MKLSGIRKRLLRKSEKQTMPQVENQVKLTQPEQIQTAVESDKPGRIKKIRSRIQSVVKWSQSPQGTNTRKFINAVSNRNNWQRIKNIRSKSQDIYKSHREPESAWMSLTLTLFVCCYLIYPNDFISDFIPLLGFIDDSIFIFLVICIVLTDLYYNIITLFQQEIKKYIAITKITLILIFAAISSLFSMQLLIPISQFFGL